MSEKDAPYTQSKIRPSVLRDAVQKVFAYKPRASEKNSVDSPDVKHRNEARKGRKTVVHAS